MSDEMPRTVETNPSEPIASSNDLRNWWLRRFCCPNPFYLLSVCFVLHGTSQWFHTDSGIAFSPWPLCWLTAGYTLLLALTGFVVIRFGQVWDDARSILLMILLLFVQLSLIFDETLVRDPVTGRTLLSICWEFSAILSEALLHGLRIRLPWKYRLPYHALLALLYFYPLSLVSFGTPQLTDSVVWKIFLFPTAAAIITLTLIPAIREGRESIRQNGTPWLWPWYPWSLYVFLGFCICFRAYALSQSFDPVLNESSQSAMRYVTGFGVYYLIPVILAVGVLLLEIGLVEQRSSVIRLALLVPLMCLFLAIPATDVSTSYRTFLRTVIKEVGSPIWITLLGAAVFYGVAMLRRVLSAELPMIFVLLLLVRVGPETIGTDTLAVPQWWPLIVIAAMQVLISLLIHSSRRMFVAASTLISCGNWFIVTPLTVNPATRIGTTLILLLASILIIGATFRDRFARKLRLAGAPLLVASTVLICGAIDRQMVAAPIWLGPAGVAALALIGIGYAWITRTPLYRVASLCCVVVGTAGFTEMFVAYLIRESGWRGATSFVTGLGCLAFAAIISSWKAGWLNQLQQWFQTHLVMD